MPFAPQIQFTGDQSIANFQQHIEQKQEQTQRLVDLGKSAEFMRKASPDFAGMVPDEQWKLMGPRDKAVAFKAFTEQLGVQAEQQKAAHLKAQTEALTSALQRQTAEDADTQNFLRGLPTGAPASAEVPGEASSGGPQFNARTALPHRPNFESMLPGLAANPRATFNPAVQKLLIEAMQHSSGGGGLDMTALKDLGFIPTGAQMNPNGTVGLQFGPPPEPEPIFAREIFTEQGKPTGKARLGKSNIDMSPPNAEGKALTQAETDRIAALNQAKQDLDNLEAMYEQLGADYGGPIAGRAKSWAMGGQNPNIETLRNAITAATPNLAKGVFREVGVLTDADMARYSSLLPTPTDTQAVRAAKFKLLRQRIEQGQTETMQTLKKAGRDLSGFETEPTESVSAGSKSADAPKVRKYNPATGRIE